MSGRQSMAQASPIEEGLRSLHFATAELKGSARDSKEAFSLHHQEKLSRMEGFGKVCNLKGGHSKPAEQEIKSFTSCSPSESRTFSRLLKPDSSPLSSTPSSSTSSFTETGSSAATDEFSPASVTSSKAQFEDVSPARSSVHRINLARKLGAVAPFSKWDDTDMHAGCNLPKPAERHALRKDMADVVNLEHNSLDCIKSHRLFGSRTRNKYFRYGSSDYMDSDKEAPIFSECPELAGKGDCQKFGIKLVAGLNTEKLPGPSYIGLAGLHTEKAPGPSHPQYTDERFFDPSSQRSLNKDWIDVYFSPVLSCPSSEIRQKHARAKTLVVHSKDIPMQGPIRHRRVHANAQFKDVECDMPKDKAIDSKCNVGSKARKGYPMMVGMKREDCFLGDLPLHGRSDAQVTPNCVLGCSTSPYEADIGIDAISLQPSRSSLSPYEETKLQSALPMHQDIPQVDKLLYLRLPATHKSAPKQLAPSNLSNEAVRHASSAEGFNFMDSVSRQKKTTVSSSSLRASSTTTRSLPITHAQEDQKKVARPSLAIPLSKARVHDDSSNSKEPSHVSSGYMKYMEKADAFVPHSPLLLKEVKNPEAQGAPMVVPPAPLPFKVQWDWRSKSMGAKASLKSAVRSLEATFSGSRSVSLPKARSPAQKEPKPETASLLDRVFVSPLRGRRKQASTLKPIERPPQSHRQSNEKESRVLLRRDTQLSALSNQARPMLVRPAVPLAPEDVDVTCKPLLPAPKSLRIPPVPRGVESLASSSRKLNWFPPNAISGVTSCMLNAQVHFSVKDGLPFYTMMMEGSDEMMLAMSNMQESHLSKDGCMWQYLFHSGQSKAKGTGGSGWRSWVRKESKAASDLAGMLHVSSAVEPGNTMATKDSSREMVVSEFVLYDGMGARVAQSQSLRFCSTDMSLEKQSMLGSARETPCSLTPSSSVHPLSVSPAYSDMAGKQNTTNLTVTSESLSSLHKGHRPGASLDMWSDLDPLESSQMPSPCAASRVELAAMVIQVSTESHKRKSNGTDGDCINELKSKGWGLKFLDGLSSLSSDVMVQEDLKSYASSRTNKSSSRKSGGSGGPASSTGNVQASALGTQSGLLGSLGSVTLLLPVGDHGLPNGGMRGPSSLIERWRCGGSCECGGWDLGCGMKVMCSNSKNKCAILPQNQSVGLFSQGSRQELVLALILIKPGEFKLSFKAQLSSLKAFATAVAILHSHHSPLLLSSSESSPSTLMSLPLPPAATPLMRPSLSSSSLLASTMDSVLKKPDVWEMPACLPQDHAAAPRRSDSFSTRDKLIPYVVLNKAFLN